MLSIIRRGQIRESVRHWLWFDRYEDASGYAFPCDAAGIVELSKLAPAGLTSLAKCRDGVGREFRAPVVREDRHAWWEPAVARCYCGAHITLDGDSECERCGRLYNSAGQELMPPRSWQERASEE